MHRPLYLIAAGVALIGAMVSSRTERHVLARGGCGPGLSQRAAVEAFYMLVDSRNFPAAFDCYSHRRQARTNFTAWQDGYRTSLHSQLLDARMLPSGHVGFSLLATDAKDGHRAYSRFTGSWTLVQEHGWRLDAANISLDARADGPSLAFSDSLLAQVHRTGGALRIRLPAFFPFPVKQYAWQIAAVQSGIAITLATSAPIAEANTIFTEVVSKQPASTGPADKRVTLYDGSRAIYYEPFAHGGNGQPSISWSQGGCAGAHAAPRSPAASASANASLIWKTRRPTWKPLCPSPSKAPPAP